MSNINKQVLLAKHLVGEFEDCNYGDSIFLNPRTGEIVVGKLIELGEVRGSFEEEFEGQIKPVWTGSGYTVDHESFHNDYDDAIINYINNLSLK